MTSAKSKATLHFTAVNQVSLVRGGKEYFEKILELIHAARESIHLQAYIFAEDQTGHLVASALMEAARRKVSVHLMADGYASQGLSKSFLHELKESGVHFRFFEPIFRGKYFYFGRRMHHKIFVVDGRYALAGGVNISNHYNDLTGKPAWLDFALYVEGEVVKQLCVLCWKTWNGFSPNMGLTPCEEQDLIFDIPLADRSRVRMRRNDWVRRKNEISQSYVQMLVHANSEVIILCSYFLPGKVIRRQIIQAIKRGVVIKVVAAGRSDVRIFKHAERWMYDWLLRKGIHLYEYQKNILHGKIAACDDLWVTAGSYNINNVSAYASIELNLDVQNPAFAKYTRSVIEGIMERDCIQITAERHFQSKNFFIQFVRWASYQLIRVIFYLFTFYYKHQA